MKYAVCRSLVLAAMLTGGCREQKPVREAAHVGDRVLTLEEALSHVDSSRGFPDRQLHEYVSYWVNTEVVYQEAKREGYENSEKVRSQLEDIQKQLVNRLYLDKQINADTQAIDDQSLRQYYAAHKQEFFVREDMIKLNAVAFVNREQASTFAATVTKGRLWNNAVENILSDTSSPHAVVSFVNGEYKTRHTLFPPELWKVAAALSVNEVSFPVKTSVGYYVLQPVSVLKSGAAADFEFAKDEVRQRLFQEHHREQYSKLLGTLRRKYNVETLIETGQSNDSMQSQTNE